VSLRRLSGTELVAVAGGLLLAVGLFLDWYRLANPRVTLNGVDGPAVVSGWEAHDVQRFLLLAAAVAPLILAYIIVRGHHLSWARGEMTAVVAIAALGLVLYAGVIDRPGAPQSLISLRFGWFVALLGVLLMLVGSALRASSTERPRKPPGVL
jgi:predicted lysophospholipase L1 biosynthesis ABC-type transport system permease subunit